MLLASFFSTMTTLSSHSQSLSVSFLILFSNAPFCSQSTRLLCSTGLSYSLLTHIILHQFIRIKQTEARKKEARSIWKIYTTWIKGTENVKNTTKDKDVSRASLLALHESHTSPSVDVWTSKRATLRKKIRKNSGPKLWKLDQKNTNSAPWRMSSRRSILEACHWHLLFSVFKLNIWR